MDANRGNLLVGAILPQLVVKRHEKAQVNQTDYKKTVNITISRKTWLGYMDGNILGDLSKRTARTAYLG